MRDIMYDQKQENRLDRLNKLTVSKYFFRL
jgi:hypothetical protein